MDAMIYGGKLVDALKLKQSDVDIEAIGHSLSNICRFGGHTVGFYSVAQHSVAVSHMVPKKYALAGLLHDAAEAYIGDVIRPLKGGMAICGDRVWGLIRAYTDVEDEILGKILRTYGLDPWLPKAVRDADNKITARELSDLLAAPGGGDARELLSPTAARAMFFCRFDELTNGKFRGAAA